MKPNRWPLAPVAVGSTAVVSAAIRAGKRLPARPVIEGPDRRGSGLRYRPVVQLSSDRFNSRTEPVGIELPRRIQLKACRQLVRAVGVRRLRAEPRGDVYAVAPCFQRAESDNPDHGSVGVFEESSAHGIKRAQLVQFQFARELQHGQGHDIAGIRRERCWDDLHLRSSASEQRIDKDSAHDEQRRACERDLPTHGTIVRNPLRLPFSPTLIEPRIDRHIPSPKALVRAGPERPRAQKSENGKYIPYCGISPKTQKYWPEKTLGAQNAARRAKRTIGYNPRSSLVQPHVASS